MTSVISHAFKRPHSQAQILDAARDLVLEIGFTAVTMTEVAERALVSRATLYRYYSTKEQLYADVCIQWAMRFIEQLRTSPPNGATVGECISATIDTVLKTAAAEPRMMMAYIATLIADEQTLRTDQRKLKALMPMLIDMAMGQHISANQELATSTLQHVLLSNLILLNAGKMRPEQILEEMQDVAAILLQDVWHRQSDATVQSPKVR